MDKQNIIQEAYENSLFSRCRFRIESLIGKPFTVVRFTNKTNGAKCFHIYVGNSLLALCSNITSLTDFLYNIENLLISKKLIL